MTVIRIQSLMMMTVRGLLNMTRQLPTNCGEHGLQSQLLTNPRGVNEIGC